MEEIYLLTLMLVIFAVAIYIIIQIPEVKDYIKPPSGNYGEASNRNPVSNAPNTSNRPNPVSNAPNTSNRPNPVSNAPNPVSSNDPVTGTLLTGILSNDFNSVVIYLAKDLYNDGSVIATSNPNLSLYNKTKFLSYNQYNTLNNMITTAVGNSNIYQTIENVSDYTKPYVLSNIPPINTSNFSNLISVMITTYNVNSNFKSFTDSLSGFSNEITKTNIMGNIYTYSANWYLNSLSNGVSIQSMISNYSPIILDYIDTQNFSNM